MFESEGGSKIDPATQDPDHARASAAMGQPEASRSSLGGLSQVPPAVLQRKLARRRAQAGAAPVQRRTEGAPVQRFPSLSDLYTGSKDIAGLVAELAMAKQFNLITGMFEGDVDIGKAAYYFKLIHPDGLLGMFHLDAASRGSNTVHLLISAYSKPVTVELSAKTLHLNGLSTQRFTSQGCTLNDVVISASSSGAGSFLVSSATLEGAAFLKGKDRIEAANVGLTRLRTTGKYSPEQGGAAALVASLSFDEAHVHGLRYPGAPPTDIDLRQAGLNLDGLWSTVGAPGAAPAAAAPEGAATSTDSAQRSGAPFIDGLPSGSRVQIELRGLSASGKVSSAALDQATGSGGFDHFHVQLVGADGAELAALAIDGFHGAAAGKSGSGTIDQLSVKGQPALVRSLLNTPQVQSQPQVQKALAAARACGVEPGIGGSLTLQHVGVDLGQDGKASAKGDVSAHLDVPDLGGLDVSLTGFAGQLDPAAQSGAFDKFTARLCDKEARELAYVELSGGAGARDAAGATTGGVKGFTVRGDLAGLVKAAEPALHQLPPAAQQALAAVQRLGLRGQVSGGAQGAVAGAEAHADGEVSFQLDVGDFGSATLALKGVRADDKDGVAGGSFTHLTARLLRKGKEAAFLSIDGASGGQRGKGLGFQAQKVAVRGEATNLSRLMGAIDKSADGLPRSVRTACAAARSYSLAASGSAALSNLAVDDDGAGHQAVRADLSAKVAVQGVGELEAKVSGFAAHTGAGDRSVSFQRLELWLKKKGNEVAYFAADGQVHGADAQHLALKARKIEARGDAGQLGALLGAARANVKLLPEQVKAAFATISDFGLEGKGRLALENVDLGTESGGAAVRADVTAGFDLAGAGKVSVIVRGFAGHAGATGPADAAGREQDVAFDSFEATLRDSHGRQAARLRVEGTQGQATAGAGGARDAHLHARRVQVEGATPELSALCSGLSQRLRSVPPAVAQAFAAVQQHSAELQGQGSLTLTEVDLRSSGSGAQASADTIASRAAIQFTDARGTVYVCPDASLSFTGARVQLGPDQRPRQIDAAGLMASGHFTSQGAAAQMKGQATLLTGAVQIRFGADGAPAQVSARDIRASGELDSAPGTQPAAAPAAQPGRVGRLAALDQTAAMAGEGARLLQSADVHTRTPLHPGRYGKGLVKIGVLPGATLNVNLVVRGRALAGGTGVEFRPALDLPAWLALRGVNLEVKGTEGVLETDLKGLFDFNLTKYVTGGDRMPLDLSGLLQQVMGHLRQSIADGPETPPATDRRADEAWLKEQHDEWAADSRAHAARAAGRGAAEQKKVADEDAADEPRSANPADLASPKGMDVMGTTGTADLLLSSASRPATVAGVTLPAAQDLHLRGTSRGGGVFQLIADGVDVQAGGSHVTATGLDTGAVSAASGDSGTHVRFDGFSLQQLRWEPARSEATS